MFSKSAEPTKGSVFFWLLAFLLLLIAPIAQAAFTDNGDGTVTDSKTGLTWMRCSMGQTWSAGTCNGTASTYTFDGAKALTNTTMLGKSDWRVPNIREFQTIVDRSTTNPAVDRVAFPNTPNLDYWSGSTGYSGGAWFANGGNGDVYGYGNRSNPNAVRLVRGGELNIARLSGEYVDNGNGTVTHTPTNLMWKRCAEGQTWTGSTCSGTASSMTASLVCPPKMSC